MSATVTASPLFAFADAIFQRLNGDATLLTLAPGGIDAGMPESQLINPIEFGATVYLSHRTLGTRAGAMQREGGNASLVVDVWSAYHGPIEVQTIQSRIRVLLQRVDLAVSGFFLYSGSLICNEEQCFQDYHPDLPQLAALYHGVQRWVGLLEELS